MTTDPRKSEAIKAALKGYEPTDEQWKAISHPLEPIYLIAGAGSGKTAVMAARIAWALETQPFSPSQVLGLTFTNKAADELLERVHRALVEIHDESGEDVTVQTYNAFAAGIVRDHGLLVGVEPESGLLSEAQQWQLLLACIDELPPFEVLEIRSSYVVGSALGLASSVADHMVGLEAIDAAADQFISMKGADPDMLETAGKRKELVRAVGAYIRAKKKAGRIDFGDQISKAVEVLEGDAEVREGYRKRFPFVLLDEYQDTNVAQRKMLQALVGDGAVTAVGDARQAIFAWRGATMFNLIGFPDDFPRDDGIPYEPVSLSENFRSGANILEVANHVVSKIPEERRPGDPLRAQDWNGPGAVALGLFSDERAEAEWIATECKRLKDSVTFEGRDPVRWRDIAILVRRKAAMDALIQALGEQKVPVEVIGLGGLLKTPEVTEVVAWLRALESKPGANRWLGRILLGPRWRIHYRDISLLARWATTQNMDLRLKLSGGDAEIARDMEPGDVAYSLAEALSHLDAIENLGAQAKQRLSAFSDRLASIRKKANAPLLELVQEIIRQAGIADALESSASETAGAAKQNISNFLDQVASFAPVEGEATLRTFIEYLDAAEKAEETLEATQPAEQDSVKLMTVHNAKGLEFECVFVPSVAATDGKNGKVWSVFPNTRGSNPLTSYSELPYEVREDRAHLPKFEGHLGKFKTAVRERVIEDERRLFYVALTRAKQRLAVSASWWYGRDKVAKGPSEFWEDLEGLEEQGLLEIVRRDEMPAENPLFDAMEDRRVWPPEPRIGKDDPLFGEGWGSVADRAVADDATTAELVAAMAPADKARTEELLAAHNKDLDLIAEAMKTEAPAEPALRDIISATNFVKLRKGETNAWTLSRPLPDRPTDARRIGTEVHRLIEEKARGISPYPEEEELDDPSKSTEPGFIEDLLGHFEASGYAERPFAALPSGELMVELPFTLKRDGHIIRGRIDAVYVDDDGGLEIVDFKTGKRFEVDDEHDQLAVYKDALDANGLLPDGKPVRLTYLFLDGEPPLTRVVA
ncbi:MAG: ATP-dependent helicase UvrD/PcrA [Actinomycetota bacterium]|jgi:DNA helicase-2/ATP-dependent DNA helicase PcrA|nr:ATP-dependent helicase UvrD/PcrA [Actinomycetota bacterium]